MNIRLQSIRLSSEKRLLQRRESMPLFVTIDDARNNETHETLVEMILECFRIEHATNRDLHNVGSLEGS